MPEWLLLFWLLMLTAGWILTLASIGRSLTRHELQGSVLAKMVALWQEQHRITEAQIAINSAALDHIDHHHQPVPARGDSDVGSTN